MTSLRSPLQSHQAPAHIGSVTLRARNMAALAAFYETSIGLARVAETADSITLGSGGVGYLHLLSAPDAMPEPQGSAGLFHTAFLLPSRAELEGRTKPHVKGVAAAPVDRAPDNQRPRLLGDLRRVVA